MSAGPLGDGPGTSYERRFAALFGEGASAVAFWKGRVALSAILRVLGVSAGDEVIVPGFTCVVVPNMVRLLGATPVYADVAAGSFNIDPAAAEALVTPRTRAILVQHSFGVAAPVDELTDLARRRGLRVIEDCAHALGGRHAGRPLGTFGDAAFFSFQWSKPYTTGLGGMALTADPDLATRLRAVQQAFRPPTMVSRLRLFAQLQAYSRFFTPRSAWRAQEVLRLISRAGVFVGSSSAGELEGDRSPDHAWRMARFQQREGERRLRTLPGRDDHARMLARRYDERLAAAGWATPARDPEAPLLRYPLQVGNKDALLEAARAGRVELGSWFETPLHPVALEHHARFGYTLGQCPEAERIAGRIVNLPLHPRVERGEADRIAGFVLERAARPAA